MTSGLRACVLTPSGRGAVAVVHVEGGLQYLDEPVPLFQAVNGKPVTSQETGRIVFGHWGMENVEDVVLLRGERSSAEIHCHGGRAAVTRILDDLQSRGAIVETWQEFTERTLAPVDAACLLALRQTTTRRTAAIVAEQQAGVLRAALIAIRQTDSMESQKKQLEALLRWSRFGRHLTQPWSVVLCGRPNVGKSSLINALMGYARSIVFDQPGTTRDVVTAETAFDGWPVELSDTAGLRTATDDIEREGVSRARQRLESADLMVLVLDTSVPPSPEDEQLLRDLRERALIVAHKSDCPNVWGDRLPADACAVSSKTGDGLDELMRRVSARLVPEVPYPGAAVPLTEEMIEHLERIRRRLLDGDSSSANRMLDEWLDPPIGQ